MKKLLRFALFLGILIALASSSALAYEPQTLLIGLRFGSTAMFSANLENAVGAGYALGYYDDGRAFHALAETEETKISVTAANDVYLAAGTYYSAKPGSGYDTYLGRWHVELGSYERFEEARAAALALGGWPCYLGGSYRARAGAYASEEEALSAASDLGGSAVRSGATAVYVTRTGTASILFEYEGAALGIAPDGGSETAETWFKGYRYHGGFSYPRTAGGNLSVLNVVGLETYVKGVLPYEMSTSFPQEALRAQAICARTFALGHRVHTGFDLCNTTCCQVYNGCSLAGEATDSAAETTRGLCLYYNGERIADAVYFSSDGGATEDAKNVWGFDTPYLKGKADPYESAADIPNYNWSVTYSMSELTWILQQKGYSVSTITSCAVTGVTENGNVSAVTFTDSNGRKTTVTGERCRTIFYSETYNKSVRSQRFTISGATGGAAGGRTWFINGTAALPSNFYVLGAGGTAKSAAAAGLYAVTASGSAALEAAAPSSGSSGDSVTITGSGSGHNVGLSQWGACAMAKQGFTAEDILQFYYTDVTIE